MSKQPQPKGSLSAAFLPSREEKMAAMSNIPPPLPSIGKKPSRSESFMAGDSSDNQTVFLVRPITRPVTEMVAEKLQTQFEAGKNLMRDESGHVIPHMILGDPKEFEEMEKLFNRRDNPSQVRMNEFR